MAAQDFSMYAGDAQIVDMAITDASGNPINITGYHIYFTGKKQVIDADGLAVFQCTTTNAQCVTTNGPGGLVTATIPSSATASLGGSYLFYDCRFDTGILGVGVTTFASGIITIFSVIGQTV